MYGFEVSIYFYICEYDCVRMSDWGGCPVLRLLHWSLILARHGHWKPKFVYRIAFSVEDVPTYFSVFQRGLCFSCFLVTLSSNINASMCGQLVGVLFPSKGFSSEIILFRIQIKRFLTNYKIWISNCNNQLQAIHSHFTYNFISQKITSHSAKVDLVGDRLCYDRIAGTGAGPDSGWVWGSPEPFHLGESFLWKDFL